jgi:hypothetical protein
LQYYIPRPPPKKKSPRKPETGSPALLKLFTIMSVNHHALKEKRRLKNVHFVGRRDFPSSVRTANIIKYGTIVGHTKMVKMKYNRKKKEKGYRK